MSWEGGDNFVKQKKWNNGKNNDGSSKRRAGLTKRGRFNPNPSGNKAQSEKDKKAYQENGRPVKFFRSGLTKG